VRDVVAIHDIIVPVSLAGLKSSTLESERSLPSTLARRVLGERELAFVTIPGAEQMYGLDIA
jgi:predicted RNase H-like nuclease